MAETYYTKDHEWLTIENDVATVGITDHAQQALGEIVFVELPEVGKMCEKQEAISVVESVKAASDVYAPLSGELIEVNTALDDSPEIVNESPETEGWFFKVKLSAGFDKEDYMSQEHYSQFVEEQG
ncbi:MAG: glycine cleavage system protein GcvH [Pseudomonadota bacterium]